MSDEQAIERAFWEHKAKEIRAETAAGDEWDTDPPAKTYLGDTIETSPDAEMERGYLHALILAHHLGMPTQSVRARLVDENDLDGSERREILKAALRCLNVAGIVTLDGIAIELEGKAAETEELYEIACGAYTTVLASSQLLLRYRTARRKRIEIAKRAAYQIERGSPVDEDALANDLKQSRVLVADDTRYWSAGDMMKSQLRALVQAEQSGVVRVNSGIAELDAELRGLDAGCMTVIGARPSVGKSTLALLIARKASHSTLIVSCEDSRDTWSQRYTAASTGISLAQLRDRRLENPGDIAAIGERIQIAQAQDLRIAVCVGARLETVQQEIASAVTRFGSKIVIVDYLQAVGFDSSSKLDTRNRVNVIVDGLKSTCAGLGVHLILLSQLKRGTNDTHEPQLLDLKESGRIEEAAENVLLMWRSESRQVFARLAKNKNGTAGILYSITQDFRTGAFGDLHRSNGEELMPKKATRW